MEETTKNYESAYQPEAWRNYTNEEIASWVGLFSKRSTMRTSKEKALKDLQDAQNYLAFLIKKTNEI